MFLLYDNTVAFLTTHCSTKFNIIRFQKTSTRNRVTELSATWQHQHWPTETSTFLSYFSQQNLYHESLSNKLYSIRITWIFNNRVSIENVGVYINILAYNYEYILILHHEQMNIIQ